MDEQDQYSLQHDFHVDDGQLDHLSKQQSFVLGYELARIVTLAEWGQDGEIVFHSDNVDRVKAILTEMGYMHRIIMHDDWPIVLLGFTALGDEEK